MLSHTCARLHVHVQVYEVFEALEVFLMLIGIFQVKMSIMSHLTYTVRTCTILHIHANDAQV